jgi:hypothetical protein
MMHAPAKATPAIPNKRPRNVMRKGLSFINLTALALGFAFLYVPIVILVI